jgi:hypothetical protein
VAGFTQLYPNFPALDARLTHAPVHDERLESCNKCLTRKPSYGARLSSPWGWASSQFCLALAPRLTTTTTTSPPYRRSPQHGTPGLPKVNATVIRQTKWISPLQSTGAFGSSASTGTGKLKGPRGAGTVQVDPKERRWVLNGDLVSAD